MTKANDWFGIERRVHELLGERLNPWLSSFITDKGGPWRESIADLVSALRQLEPDEIGPFMAWAESDRGRWWHPGYEVHPPEDAVASFRFHRDLCELRGESNL